jgi:hypothetical protein
MLRRGENISVKRVLLRQPDGRKPLARPKRVYEDNIKMNLKVSGRKSWC